MVNQVKVQKNLRPHKFYKRYELSQEIGGWFSMLRKLLLVQLYVEVWILSASLHSFLLCHLLIVPAPKTKILRHYTFLGNCPPTPPLSHH